MPSPCRNLQSRIVLRSLLVLFLLLPPMSLAITTFASHHERHTTVAPLPATGVLSLKKGDHICLVGNALGERMQHVNYWETLLHSRFAKHNLVVRNLCFPADEPYLRLRSLNFGSPDDYLKKCQADVILYFFGLNESFAGEKGLPAFAADVTKLVKETKAKTYNGKSPPRIVLISPIAHEDLGDANVTDGKAHNLDLERYTEALATVAKKTGVGFVDLFTPTRELFADSEKILTLNGVHLNDDGYKALAPILDRALFGAGTPKKFDARLRAEIADRSFHWWHRYRAVNGFYIYGGRAGAGFDGTYRNREVMERELTVLEQMCDNRDRRIWALAQGKTVSAKVDDSNTLPLIQPKSNVGKSKRNKKKLGTLKYLSSKDQLKTFRLPPGYRINLFASEEDFPELANPVAINFDNKGRLWVAVMPAYPQWQPKTKMRDKLLILEDTDADGRAERCKVFVDDLHLPTGFELGHGGVYVAQQPDLLYLRDTDGDDKADVRIRALIGFDSADSHHGLAAFEWGPGGALYFQEGTFKQSQVETPYGPRRLSDAGVWRYEPRTERFDVHVAFAFANPWGHVFDRWGQNFLADASPGLNYWATPISGHVTYPARHPGGRREKALKHPLKKEYPTFVKKRIRPSSGCEIVSSRNFPPEAQGNFLLNNVIGDRAVLQFTMRDEGSGFTGSEAVKLVESKDGNFRPVDLQFGPDGALYICDWHNALIGHLQHNLRDPNRDQSHGRIWRVTYSKRPLVKPAKIAGQPLPHLLDLLKAPEARTRYRARRELAARKTTAVMASLKTWVARLDVRDDDYAHHLMEALWLHQSHNQVNATLLKKVLTSANAEARAAATRVLCHWRNRLPKSLQILHERINDSHPRVRLEAVRACSFYTSADAMAVALDALNHDMDYYLKYTLEETLRALDTTLARNVKHTSPSHHHHGAVAKPFVFLDKSPKVVQFQLARLSNVQLLLVERSAEHAKYRPVYQAILSRPGMSLSHRQEALVALTKLKRSDAVAEVLTALGHLDATNKSERLIARHLSTLLLRQPKKQLTKHVKALHQATTSNNASVRATAFAGLVAAGQTDIVGKLARSSRQGQLDFLASVSLLPDKTARAKLRDMVIVNLTGKRPLAVRRAALVALVHIPTDQAKNFQLAASFVKTPKLRATAVRTMLRIPKKHRPVADARQVAKTLIAYAEGTRVATRTTNAFLDAVQLTEELLSQLPVKEARMFRARLREVTVRIIRLNTVQEEMRYDKSYFAVEAGRPVQLILANEDLMPHNLVVTVPGGMREVAELAAGMSTAVDRQGRQFVPASKKVLFASKMVAADAQVKMIFTAPKKPGEYPYVCTFPGHWTRMYGVMVVVEDLDAWLANPKKPADPLGNDRPFVKSWTPADFAGDLSLALRGRQPTIGKKLFEQANCIHCHKIDKEGGAIGPELNEVYKRWKGDDHAVLREILVPSHKVDPKYTVQTIVTKKGAILSGLVSQQDRGSVTLIANPLKPVPQVVSRNDIETMIASSTSIMPRGLMDRFTRDEIYELLAYLKSRTVTKK